MWRLWYRWCCMGSALLSCFKIRLRPLYSIRDQRDQAGWSLHSNDDFNGLHGLYYFAIRWNINLLWLPEVLWKVYSRSIDRGRKTEGCLLQSIDKLLPNHHSAIYFRPTTTWCTTRHDIKHCKSIWVLNVRAGLLHTHILDGFPLHLFPHHLVSHFTHNLCWAVPAFLHHLLKGHWRFNQTTSHLLFSQLHFYLQYPWYLQSDYWHSTKFYYIF